MASRIGVASLCGAAWNAAYHDNGKIAHRRMTPYVLLRGQSLSNAAFDADTHEWVFTFTGQRVLRVAAPWRLLSDGTIVLGFEDDGQLFGLTTPIDANARIGRAVAGQEVIEVATNLTGDLDVHFGSGLRLQVFNGSCGYEGWQLFAPGQRCVVAQGGGRVIDSDDNPGLFPRK